MHCPICGQKQLSEETRFCSRCGFPLTGVAELVSNNGLMPAPRAGIAGNAESRRRRGIKQGAFVFLLSFLIVPILIMIAVALEMEPFLPFIGLFLLVGGGLLRMIYALMFESGEAAPVYPGGPTSLPGGAEERGALPPSQSVPASVYTTPTAGSWRDTNDLQHQPGSVTDGTTKLLQQDERDQ